MLLVRVFGRIDVVACATIPRLHINHFPVYSGCPSPLKRLMPKFLCNTHMISCQVSRSRYTYIYIILIYGEYIHSVMYIYLYIKCNRILRKRRKPYIYPVFRSLMDFLISQSHHGKHKENTTRLHMPLCIFTDSLWLHPSILEGVFLSYPRYSYIL